MCFPVGSAAAFGSPNSRRIEWVQKVHIHRHMKSCRVSRGNLESFLDYLRHATLVELTHGVDSDPKRFDHLAFTRVDAARPDDHGVLRQDLGRKAADISQFRGALSQ